MRIRLKFKKREVVWSVNVRCKQNKAQTQLILKLNKQLNKLNKLNKQLHTDSLNAFRLYFE